MWLSLGIFLGCLILHASLSFSVIQFHRKGWTDGALYFFITMLGFFVALGAACEGGDFTRHLPKTIIAGIPTNFQTIGEGIVAAVTISLTGLLCLLVLGAAGIVGTGDNGEGDDPDDDKPNDPKCWPDFEEQFRTYTKRHPTRPKVSV